MAEDTRFESAPTVVPAGRDTPPAGTTYEGMVRFTLIQFGSPFPDKDLIQTKDYWKHCRDMGISPQTCGALIYETVRHRHDQTVTLREGAGENGPASGAASPMRDEWEVRIPRTRGASVHRLVEVTGRKPDEITADTIIYGDFYDDEKARAFARKLAEGGVISTYGPRRRMAAEDRAGYSWVHVRFQELADAKRFAGLVEKEGSEIGTEVGGTKHGATVTTNAQVATIERVLHKHKWKGHYTVPMQQAAEDEGDPSAMGGAAERVEAVGEPVAAANVPWVKVTRDAGRYESSVRTADKIGPIKTPKKIYELLGETLNQEDQEVFIVVLLDLRGNLRGVCEVARGQRSRVTVGPADVLRPVLTAGAEGFIVCHNHPSGKAEPSKADRDLTKKIAEATKPYGKDVCFIDHCVVGLRQVYSICEGKMYRC
jgi:DNA repair protein RadC